MEDAARGRRETGKAGRAPKKYTHAKEAREISGHQTSANPEHRSALGPTEGQRPVGATIRDFNCAVDGEPASETRLTEGTDEKGDVASALATA